MAKKPSPTTLSSTFAKGKPKKTRQGNGLNTRLSATSRNGAKKRDRGQGS
jgi:hypothetical protein